LNTFFLWEKSFPKTAVDGKTLFHIYELDRYGLQRNSKMIDWWYKRDTFHFALLYLSPSLSLFLLYFSLCLSLYVSLVFFSLSLSLSLFLSHSLSISLSIYLSLFLFVSFSWYFFLSSFRVTTYYSYFSIPSFLAFNILRKKFTFFVLIINFFDRHLH
jgi:hypothetical protein